MIGGKGVLAVMDGCGQAVITPMELLRLYVVGAGERHAVVLKPDSRVLIMENEDMSQFQTEEMDTGICASIGRVLDGL